LEAKAEMGVKATTTVKEMDDGGYGVLFQAAGAS
jgi:hypothetical protein